jgi:hypothetical protein
MRDEQLRYGELARNTDARSRRARRQFLHGLLRLSHRPTRGFNDLLRHEFKSHLYFAVGAVPGRERQQACAGQGSRDFITNAVVDVVTAGAADPPPGMITSGGSLTGLGRTSPLA